jgi:hypothetical protein
MQLFLVLDVDLIDVRYSPLSDRFGWISRKTLIEQPINIQSRSVRFWNFMNELLMRTPNILNIFQFVNLRTGYNASLCRTDTVQLSKAEIYHDLGGQDSIAEINSLQIILKIIVKFHSLLFERDEDFDHSKNDIDRR